MTLRVTIVKEPKGNQATQSAVRKAAFYLKRMGCETREVLLSDPSVSGSTITLTTDVVLLSTGSGKSHQAVARVHETFPHARLLVATEAPKAGISKAYSAGAAVVAPPNAFLHAVRNVVYVGSRQILTAFDAVRTESISEPVRHPIDREVVESFHDSQSGRLDGARIAAAYGLSLSAREGG